MGLLFLDLYFRGTFSTTFTSFREITDHSFVFKLKIRVVIGHGVQIGVVFKKISALRTRQS